MEKRTFRLRRNIVLLLGLALLLAVVTTAAAPQYPSLATIDIITINDFHGALVEAGKNPGAGKFAAFLKSERAKNPEATIFLSAGDMFQGSPDSNLLYGKTVVEVLNAMQLDAMTLGNHEFDWGLDKLKERVEQSHFPYVSANVREKISLGSLDFVKPYVMTERIGIKIAIVGIVTPDTAYTTSPKTIENLEFVDPASIVSELIPKLRAQGADLIVVLSHVPSYMNQTTGQVTGDVVDMIEGAPGIDAVVSGHSHQVVQGKVNGVPVVQAYYNGRNLGKISLVYSRTEGKVVFSTAQSLTVPITGVISDPWVQSIVNRAQKEIAPVKDVVIGRTVRDLSHDRYELSLLGQWTSDAMRAATGADIALQNGGGLRTSIPAGAITMGTLYEVMPFDNTLITMELTGRQILQALNHGTGNQRMGDVQFSGVWVQVDRTLPFGSRVIAVTMPDGAPLDLDKSYKVVTNDFMAAGGDEYAVFKEGKNVTDTFITMRYMLMLAVKNAGIIDFRPDNRLLDSSKKTSMRTNRVAA